MIIAITGKVEKKEPTHIHLLTPGGLVYEVFVSLHCSAAVTEKEIKLHTTHIVREDAQLLYGFLDLNEKKMFDTLIKISGVGPKAAMAVCSTFTPTSFAQIVQNNDVAMLKRVPGIGPKSANRILVELSDFGLENFESTGQKSTKTEAALALESLGFKKDLVYKTLAACKETRTEALIKEALKKLSK